MDRMNAHSTNRDGLLLLRSESRSAATTSSASHFVLQWGSRKRLRCMAKDHSTSTDPTGSRTVRRATARIECRVVRSDANNNASKDPIPNRHNTGNSVGNGSGHLNLRQRPASPSPRNLRNSEGSTGMKEHGNGVRDLASLDRKFSSINTNSNNKITIILIITTPMTTIILAEAVVVGLRQLLSGPRSLCSA